MSFYDLSRAESRVQTGSLLCGKWRIGKLIGVGGTSVVHAAVHRNGRRAAIKFLHPEFCLNDRARQRFLREGYIANRVGHPGVVAVLDDGVADDGTMFLVMELLHGQTLGSRLCDLGPLDPLHVFACADEVLQILTCAHEKGIVHRDIKPENLFLTVDRTLKLLDFGIASVRELSAVTPCTTRAGAAFGTPAFMAPEQARGRADLIGPRTDLWALGATVFTLLTGRHVHEGLSGSEVSIAAATREARSLASVCPGLDPALVRVVDGALRLDSRDRWPDAATMQHALRSAFTASSPMLPSPSGEATRGATEETDVEGLSSNTVLLPRNGSTHAGGRSRRWPRQLRHAASVLSLAAVLGIPLVQTRGGRMEENSSTPATARTPSSVVAPGANAPELPAPSVEPARRAIDGAAPAEAARRAYPAPRRRPVPSSSHRSSAASRRGEALMSDEVLDQRE
jgi:eukaryotic-like serine/threonine-protein kinase